jgi:hypothetical protein
VAYNEAAMKVVITFDMPDSWKLADTLEAFVRDAIIEFDKGRGRDTVQIYRVRRFTDARFREIVDKVYAQPRRYTAWMRRWRRVNP